MTHHIEVQIFNQPSGDVRGIVFALRGKDRLAHAYLHTEGKPPKITLDRVKGKPTVADIREITAALSGFADAVARNS